MNDMKIRPFAVIGFLLELCALATLSYFGFTMFAFPLSVIVGLGLPLVAIVLWGLFRAPRRPINTPFWVRIAVEVLVMGAGAVALVLAGRTTFGAIFAALALISGVVNGLPEYREEKRLRAAS